MYIRNSNPFSLIRAALLLVSLMCVDAIIANARDQSAEIYSATGRVIDAITAQIEAVASDITIHATKTGMLGSAAIVEAVAAAIDDLQLPLLVVDPVMVAKSGDVLLDEDGVRAMKAELLPQALVVTPNIP